MRFLNMHGKELQTFTYLVMMHMDGKITHAVKFADERSSAEMRGLTRACALLQRYEAFRQTNPPCWKKYIFFSSFCFVYGLSATIKN